LFTKLEKDLAGRPLDILVNNAAVAPQITVHETTPEEFDRIFAINVRAPFFIIQRALPLMPDGGRIINISSGVSDDARWITGQTLDVNGGLFLGPKEP